MVTGAILLTSNRFIENRSIILFYKTNHYYIFSAVFGWAFALFFSIVLVMEMIPDNLCLRWSNQLCKCLYISFFDVLNAPHLL